MTTFQTMLLETSQKTRKMMRLISSRRNTWDLRNS